MFIEWFTAAMYYLPKQFVITVAYYYLVIQSFSV